MVHEAKVKKKMESAKLYINRCLQLAQLGEYYVAPNPMVGAMLVRHDADGDVILGAKRVIFSCKSYENKSKKPTFFCAFSTTNTPSQRQFSTSSRNRGRSYRSESATDPPPYSSHCAHGRSKHHPRTTPQPNHDAPSR